MALLIPNGARVFGYDHRGQGHSTHLVQGDPYKHHVDDWTHYTDDLVNVANKLQPTALVCFSMGGAICLDALQRLLAEVASIKKVVFVAPMVEMVLPAPARLLWITWRRQPGSTRKSTPRRACRTRYM